MFPEFFSRPVRDSFDEPDSTSDGGALLLRALDESLRLTTTLGGCLRDDREPSKVQHEFLEMLRQRVFGVATGYEDANDAARIGRDSLHKILAGRDPEDEDLASQSTLSRFENSVGSIGLYRMGDALADLVIERHKKRLSSRRVKTVTIDMDDTVDPTHGAQQLSLFNGKYGTWCYLPLLGFLTFNDEPQQYLVTAVLRPGTSWTKGAVPVLSRLLKKVRKAFPKAKVRVRLDANFARL